MDVYYTCEDQNPGSCKSEGISETQNVALVTGLQ